MVGTQLLIDNGATTPLGRIHVAGTISGSNRVSDRILHEYAWVYVLAGDAHYRDELGSSENMTAGDGLVIFPGVRHSYGGSPGKTWDQIYFVFDGPIFTLLESTHILDRHAPVTRNESAVSLKNQILAFADRPRPTNDRERIVQICSFAQLLSSSVLEPTKQSSWLDRAYARLSLDIDKPVDLDSVARSLGMGYESFRKRFRREAGVAPRRYRELRRIAAASELLRSTPLTLGQIAATLGYSDEYHLSKRFKASNGVTPRAYRHETRVL